MSKETRKERGSRDNISSSHRRRNRETYDTSPSRISSKRINKNSPQTSPMRSKGRSKENRERVEDENHRRKKRRDSSDRNRDRLELSEERIFQASTSRAKDHSSRVKHEEESDNLRGDQFYVHGEYNARKRDSPGRGILGKKEHSPQKDEGIETRHGSSLDSGPMRTLQESGNALEVKNVHNELEAPLEDKISVQKVEPTFGLSGKLAEETNKVKGVTLQFVEPPEARKPSTRWRLYVFKDGEPLNGVEPLYIHRQSCYLFGRERRVADVPTDHPSCSKQHAVLQYRLVQKEEEFTTKNIVKPYVMDLGSTNGTFLNGARIESERYYELLEKDTLKFGNSSREYVLLHENSIS